MRHLRMLTAVKPIDQELYTSKNCDNNNFQTRASSPYRDELFINLVFNIGCETLGAV